MNLITLYLQSAIRTETIADIASFIGKDLSGSFGIQPGRAALITVLEYGLSRFRTTAGVWYYLASPGAVLHFADNQLTINTRYYLYHQDHERIAGLLTGQLAEEEKALSHVKHNLQQLEQELFRRLRQLDRWSS